MSFIDYLKVLFFLFVAGAVVLGAAFIAPFVVFAAKVGYVRVRISSTEDAHLQRILPQSLFYAAAFVIIVSALSLCWTFWLFASQPEIYTSFVTHYAPGCEYTTAGSGCGLSAWWSMMGEEAWPFFLATLVTVVGRAVADGMRANGSSLWATAAFLAPIVSAVAFLLFLHGAALQSAFDIFGALKGEIASVADPFRSTSIGDWLHAEFIRLNGSLFKLSALYPKVFWIIILWYLLRGSIELPHST